MYAWLERDLSSVDRNKTPWVIVHGHRPMYCPTTETAVVLEDYNGEGDYVPPSSFSSAPEATVGKKKKPNLGGLCKWEQESSRLRRPERVRERGRNELRALRVRVVPRGVAGGKRTL